MEEHIDHTLSQKVCESVFAPLASLSFQELGLGNRSILWVSLHTPCACGNRLKRDSVRRRDHYILRRFEFCVVREVHQCFKFWKSSCSIWEIWEIFRTATLIFAAFCSSYLRCSSLIQEINSWREVWWLVIGRDRKGHNVSSPFQMFWGFALELGQTSESRNCWIWHEHFASPLSLVSERFSEGLWSKGLHRRVKPSRFEWCRSQPGSSSVFKSWMNFRIRTGDLFKWQDVARGKWITIHQNSTYYWNSLP